MTASRVDFIDEIAVDLAVRGERKVRLTPAEKVEAVRVMAGNGISDRVIAERLGIWHASVCRIRTQHDITGSALPPIRHATRQSEMDYRAQLRPIRGVA